MQTARSKGAEAVWIVNGHSTSNVYGDSEAQGRRVETIIKPIMELSGIEYQFSDKEPEGLEVVWPEKDVLYGAHLMRWATILKKPFPLRPTNQALERVWDKFGGRKRKVLSVRNQPYQPSRNTGDGQRKWALENDAIVIEDESVSLDERVAHYELAEVTVGVGGGHMMPAVYSENRPYLIVKQIVDGCKASRPHYYMQQNMPIGFQFQWAGKHQKIDWIRSDSYEDTKAAYEDYLSGQGLP